MMKANDITDTIRVIKQEIEDYYQGKSDEDCSIWTEKGLIDYIYKKIEEI